MTVLFRIKRGERAVLGLPSRRRTSIRADPWRSELGASEYLVRTIRYGISDMPLVPLMEGVVIGEIPQSEEGR